MSAAGTASWSTQQLTELLSLVSTMPPDADVVQRAIEQSENPDADDRKWAVVVEGIDGPVGFTALYGLHRQTAR